jgi:hypothetical protein
MNIFMFVLIQFLFIYYYVWCWRGTNHYSIYKLSYMWCLATTLCVQSWQSMVGTGTKCWCIVLFCVYFFCLYHYVWCWRGPNHYPLYVLSYMLSYILLCICSLGRSLLVPVLRVGVSISICLHHYVWCWRGPNRYPLYVLRYMLSYILLCVCSLGRLLLVPVLCVGT